MFSPKHSAPAPKPAVGSVGVEGALDADIHILFNNVYSMGQQGLHRQAMDAIMNFFDDALIEHDLDKCRRGSPSLDPERLSASTILVVLHITGKAKEWLQDYRDAFYRRAVAALEKDRGRQQAERLLSKHK